MSSAVDDVVSSTIATESTDLLGDGCTSGAEAVSDSPSTRGQMIIVMRHGERRDGAVNAVPEADPPLTEQGLADVSNAARKLRTLLGDQVARNLQLLVSPFLRTTQTAQRLQECGIGASCRRVVDNGLCEVFGPVRIKSQELPQLPHDIVMSGRGALPLWGESMELAAKRFVETLHSGARAYSASNLLLVTHGDALSAIVSEFYPMRMVYEAEYLSFIVLRKRDAEIGAASAGRGYDIVAASGVQWMVTGLEDIQTVNEPAGPDPSDGHAKVGKGASSRLSKNASTGGSFHRPYEVDGASLIFDSLNAVGDEGQNAPVDIWLPFVFRVFCVASQTPLFFSSQLSVRDVGVHIVVILLLELVFFYASVRDGGWLMVSEILVTVENFPAICQGSYTPLAGENGPGAQRPDLLQVFCATLLKCAGIFAVIFSVAALVSLFPGANFTMFHSYKIIFTSFWSAALVLLLFLFNFARVYCYASLVLMRR